MCISFYNPCSGYKNYYSEVVKSYLIDIVFSIKGKSKRKNIVFLVVGTAVVEHVLWRDALPIDFSTNFIPYWCC